MDTPQDSQKPTPFKRHFHRSCVGKEPGSNGRHQGGMTSYFGLFPPDNKTNTKCILSKSFGKFPQNLRLSPLTPSCGFLFEEFRGNPFIFSLRLNDIRVVADALEKHQKLSRASIHILRTLNKCISSNPISSITYLVNF